MESKLTLIFGFRNREVFRVKRCLDSLANQTTKNFSVIFIDYGSDEVVSFNIKKLVDSYSFCHYVFNHTIGQVWNRSHALNSGIRLAQSEYVLTTDIDLIYPANFIEVVLVNLAEKIELHANAYALPEKFNQWGNLQVTPKKLKARDITALGLVQGVSTLKLNEIRGFDEYFRIWGVEDYDLQVRLKNLGVNTKWLALEMIPIHHQWHPSSSKRTRSRIPRGWQKYMALYCKKNEHKTVRNETSWGKILSIEDRPAFQSLSKQNKLEITELVGIPFLGIQEELDQFLYQEKSTIKKFIFTDDNFENFKKSKLTQTINYLNALSDKLNLPVLLSNDSHFYGMASSVYDYWDVVMFWLLRNSQNIMDYHLTFSDDKIVLIVNK